MKSDVSIYDAYLHSFLYTIKKSYTNIYKKDLPCTTFKSISNSDKTTAPSAKTNMTITTLQTRLFRAVQIFSQNLCIINEIKIKISKTL